MEFILEAAALEQCGELLIGWKQAFLIATGQKEIRRGSGIGSSRQSKRIILAPMFISPSTKNSRMCPVLPYSLERKRTTGHIDGGTNSSGKDEEIGMLCNLLQLFLQKSCAK